MVWRIFLNPDQLWNWTAESYVINKLAENYCGPSTNGYFMIFISIVTRELINLIEKRNNDIFNGNTINAGIIKSRTISYAYF